MTQMTYRPAFSNVRLVGDTLTISGSSLDADPGTQFQILVAIEQGSLHAETYLVAPGGDWHADIPVDSLEAWPLNEPDDAHPAPPPTFDPHGMLVCFGSETRGNPFMAISWHQLLRIEAHV